MSAWSERLINFIRDKRSERGYACDICGAELFDYPRPRVCDGCMANFVPNNGLLCPKCGRRTVAEGVCLLCKRDAPAFDVGTSPFVYFGPIAGILNRMKTGARYLSYFFGEEMSARLMETMKTKFNADMGALNEEEKKNYLLVSVPLTAERRKARGYDQAEDLARVVSVRTGIAYIPGVLIKKRETSKQKELSVSERKDNVEGAYRVGERKLCAGKTVILIDDIMTTGATGNECARMLVRAGAARVIFLTAASLKEMVNVV